MIATINRENAKLFNSLFKLKTPYILAISSFAVHGTASLKTFITILGEKILPVPSLMLNGLTNMELVKKFDPPFKELLQGTFELAVNREIDLILYIGYLGNATQAATITEMIHTYRAHIKTIIADPVCGDHGRTYVPQNVIDQWPSIIHLADIAFPNITELRILTGNQPGDDGTEPDMLAAQFKQLFPTTTLVVTSIKNANTMGIQTYGQNPYCYTHPILPQNYGGSGDAFLAMFILNHYYHHLPFNDALQLAAGQTYQVIKNSIDNNSTDLLLSEIKSITIK